MTKDSWDWSFASFAEEPAIEDDDAAPVVDDDEPTVARPFPAGAPAGDALERHLWTLRMATTPEQRRAAAAEALRFLEQQRQAALKLRRRALEEDPTVVDERVPAHLAQGFLDVSSSGDNSRP